MARPQEQIKWVAPRGGLLVDAYRQEAASFDREGKEQRAIQYRKAADRMEAAQDAMKTAMANTKR